MANHLTTHDSANTHRCSIDRLVQGEFWAIASQTGLLRKPNPTPEHLNGMGFTVEASSGNCSPESALRLGCNFPMGPSGKLRPGICSRNRTRFPRGPKQPPAPRQNDPFPPSHAERPRSVPGCRHNRNGTGSNCNGGRGRSSAAGSILPQQQKPALATNVTCAGLVGAHKGTLQRPTSVMDYRAAPARDASVGLPSNEARHSLRQSAQYRQSADTAK